MRDKIIEVMARGVFENFRVEEVGPAVVSWDAHGCHVPAHDAYLDAARAALTALQAEGMAVVPGWQPIESAPKDGTRLILSWGGKTILGYYLDNSHTKWPWKGWKVPSMETWPMGGPDAWQPMPAPYAAGDGKASMQEASAEGIKDPSHG